MPETALLDPRQSGIRFHKH